MRLVTQNRFCCTTNLQENIDPQVLMQSVGAHRHLCILLNEFTIISLDAGVHGILNVGNAAVGLNR